MNQTLEYRPPEPSPAIGLRIRQLRMLAGALATFAAAWAVFGTIQIIEDETWHRGPSRTLLVWGSSYVVAIGLGYRALARPSATACRILWAVSFLIQGAWLLLVVIETFFSRGGGGILALPFMLAFAGCTALSLVGLALEPAQPSAA